ncbi:MAG: THUMP domain-containing protein [Methanomassiliicoccales archaeon]|jgi:thiamine biosynthesis protein ThiI
MMSLLLVRYAEVGLKSESVRNQFERILVNNILDSFAKEGIECLVERERGRIFVETRDIDRAIKCLKRIFGIASISSVTSCSSELEEMRSFAVEYSAPLLTQGSTFALRVRRTGSHDYSSMDVARELGAAILESHKDRAISVDLASPDIEIFVEIRGSRAYFFSEYIPGPGGLPLGSQGKVLAIVNRERDVVAAWLMMKRGCRVIVLSDSRELIKILEAWSPRLTIEQSGQVEQCVRKYRALAVVFGYGSSEMEEIKKVKLSVPAFFPLIGFDDQEVGKKFKEISA